MKRRTAWARAVTGVALSATAFVAAAASADPLADGRAAEARGDFAAAVDLYAQAAEGGSLDALPALGHLYEQGNGVPQDLGEARMWYLRGAEEGQAEAATGLGTLYLAGRGVKENDAEAARWYAMAAELGYGPAEAALAQLYLAGRGVARDLILTDVWATLAVNQGIATAMATRDAALAGLSPAQQAEASTRARQTLVDQGRPSGP